jgi:hypothetical protein
MDGLWAPMTSVLLSGCASTYWRSITDSLTAQVFGLALKYVACDTGGIVRNTPHVGFPTFAEAFHSKMGSPSTHQHA